MGSNNNNNDDRYTDARQGTQKPFSYLGDVNSDNPFGSTVLKHKSAGRPPQNEPTNQFLQPQQQQYNNQYQGASDPSQVKQPSPVLQNSPISQNSYQQPQLE